MYYFGKKAKKTSRPVGADGAGAATKKKPAAAKKAAPPPEAEAPPPDAETPAAADAAAPADASTATAAPTPAPPAEKPSITTGLGEDVDRVAEKSPTLKNNIEKLQADGWTIQYGEAGKGSDTDRPKKTINIDPDEKSSTMQVVQTLSHESGHARYTPDPYVQPDGLTKDQYVDKNVMSSLKDEGEATLTNAQVRKELIAAGQGDIGIAGAQPDQYQAVADKYPDPKDRDTARTEIAKVFGDGEHPSTDPSKTYSQYYGGTYSNYWDQLHPPASGGTGH